MPNEAYDIVKVRNVPNAGDQLSVFKQTIITFLDNRQLSEEHPKWNVLLPKKVVRFTEQL